jgi:hypothetical protein
MTNILTVPEAANTLRCATDDPAMLDLLPLVDAAINEMTGHDWTADAPVSSLAKAAARILITRWHEDPGMMANRNAILPFGLEQALLTAALNALSPVAETVQNDQIGNFVSTPAANLP